MSCKSCKYGGVVLHYILTGQVPELDSLLRPKFAFDIEFMIIVKEEHILMFGEFVEEWGDRGAQNNWCLYKVGCKGPMTFNNCSIIRYNEGTNYQLVQDMDVLDVLNQFWDKYAYQRPMANANIKAPTGGVEKLLMSLVLDY